VNLLEECGRAGDMRGRHRGAGSLAEAEMARLARHAGREALRQDVDARSRNVGLEHVADAGAARGEVRDNVGRVPGLIRDRVQGQLRSVAVRRVPVHQLDAVGVADEDRRNRDLGSARARGHIGEGVAGRGLVVDDHEAGARVLGIEHLQAEVAGAAADECGLAVECAGRESAAAFDVGWRDNFCRDIAIRPEERADRQRCTELRRTVGHAGQVRRHRLRCGDLEAPRGIGAGRRRRSDVDVVRGRMVARALAGAGVAVRHADEDARLDGVDQGRIEGVEFAAQAARPAAPGVVQNVGAVLHDIFQRLDAFGVVEGAVVRDAVVEHTVAQHIGLGSHAAERHRCGAEIAGLHFVARSGGRGVRAVFGAARAGPDVLITG